MSHMFLEAVIGGARRELALDPGTTISIGRSADNTVVLEDTQISRHHAMVQISAAGLCTLIDLSSRNGTFLNQRRVLSPTVLHPGDRFVTGSHAFVFHAPATAVPALVPDDEAGATIVELHQRTVTVLVADIRDFTGWAARLGESRLSEIVSSFLHDAGAVLDRNGSWAQKYIGDAVMAIWTHAASTATLAELKGAFRSLDAIFDLAAGLESRFGLHAPIRIGAGMNTGLASLGNMGSESASDYTALSDAVNMAFRLESATRFLGCDLALGRRTHELLANASEAAGVFTPHTVELKGYREPKPVFASAREGVRAVTARLFP
jgi:adenylate cyclase